MPAELAEAAQSPPPCYPTQSYALGCCWNRCSGLLESWLSVSITNANGPSGAMWLVSQTTGPSFAAFGPTPGRSRALAG